MKVVTYICDICGRECDPDQMLHTQDEKDVCAECLEKLVIKHFETGTVAEEKAEPKTEKQKPAEAVTKRGFDAGKAQALRDAGWTVDAISEEMGFSSQTIFKYTHPTGPKKSKPLEWADEDFKRSGETDLSELQEVMKS